MGRPIAIAILGAALWVAAPMALPAGLGRLTVLSPLGAPLSAEIEVVSLQPGEEDGLSARIASPQAFKQAGIEFSPALLAVKFAFERRGNQRVLRLSSTQPIHEPFLDLLVELQWPTGRLVREYSILLDPPGYRGPEPIAAAPAVPRPPAMAPAPAPKPEAAEATAREVKPAPALEARPLDPAPETKATPAALKPAAQAEAQTQEPEEEAPPADEKAQASQTTSSALPHYKVQKGDTLGTIAHKHLPPGVTLNQMLLAIYRENEEAFLRENINLVRAGRILIIPEAEAVGTVNVGEANELVKSHADEFNAYRSRLAAVATAVETGPGERAASGPIESKVRAAPAAPQDQVKLSKADPKSTEAAAARAARDDDLASRERALKEAQSRITDLEKNVSDLQKMLEIRNQQLAELQKKAEAKPPSAQAPASVPPPVATVPAKPAAAEAPKASAEAPKSSPEAPKPPPEAAKPPPAGAPKPKPKVAPPPPPPPPSLLDEVLDNPAALGGLGLVVVLLLGYVAWSARRKKATRAKFQDSVLGAAAGGATGASTSLATAPASQGASSQGAVGAMEAEDVDPIAEADVYMAYGRDAQAEEILKEALQKDGTRTALHAKLLEIFAKRADTGAFEQTAVKLRNLTNGAGPEWEKAAALGRSIDPQNSLYGGSGAAAPTAPVFAAASAAAAPAVDFDLGGATSAGMIPDIPLDEPKRSEVSALDFDLGTAPASASEKTDFAPEGTFIREPKAAEATFSALDFDLGGAEKPAAPAPTPWAPEAKSEPSGLDFDLNLDLGDTKGNGEMPAAPAPDLSSISLDLGSAGEPAGAGGTDPKWQEVATKLDLAKAYEEMGDKDGARELLGEVMKDGDAAQKGQAEQILAKLG